MNIPREAVDQAQLGDMMRRWYWSISAFARDITPWGKEGTPYADWKRPFRWTEEVFAELDQLLAARYLASAGGESPQLGPIGVLIASGVGTGKSSYLIPVMVAWALTTRPYSCGVMTASSEDQLKNRAWGDTKIFFDSVPFLRSRFNVTERYISEKALGAVRPGMIPRWGISPMCPAPERAERLHGLHSMSCTLAVFEEAEGVPDANARALLEGIVYDANPIALACGNPIKPTGWFGEGADENGATGVFRHWWNIRRNIDIRDIENMTPAKRALIEQRIAAHGGEESDYARSKVRGLTPRTTRLQFIPEPLVREAQERSRRMFADENEGPMRGLPIQMAVDLARGGENETVAMFRSGLDAASFKPVRKKGRMLNPMQTVQFLKGLLDEDHALPGQPPAKVAFAYVDITGTGGEVTHMLHTMGYRNVLGVQMGGAAPDAACANYRAYAWKRALHFLSAGGLLPLDEDGMDLARELMLPEYSYTDRGGRLLIEPKEDLMKRNNGKSIDLADTFSMLCLPTPASLERARMRRWMRGGPAEKARLKRQSQRRKAKPWRG